MTASWKPIAQRKQAERDALIPQDWRLKKLPSPDTLNVTDIPAKSSILSSLEIEITERYDATALVEAIRDRRLTAVQVTMAFCKRAAIAQQLTNCLTEIMFESALARAANLDHYQSQHNTVVGPLHGLPISLKDSFKIAGKDASIGIAALCHKPATESAHLAQLLTRAGAVLFCKTNIPQTLGTLDSTNNIFGRTLNPLNKLCTAGGSTGGEGALIAMHGSPLGVGTDIGGSIRVPAMCNGIYGIKPSANRVPWEGQEGGGPPGGQQLGLIASAGPMAQSLRDCEMFLKVVADAQPWKEDTMLIPGLWDSSSLDIRPASSLSTARGKETLTIGILSHDGTTTPLPPIQSLLREVAASLAKTTHPTTSVRVVSLPTPSILRHAQNLGNKLMGLDGGNSMLDLLESHNEPLVEWLQKMGMKRRPQASFAQMKTLYAEAERMRNVLASELWRVPAGQAGQGEEIDAIITPVAPHPTPKIDSWGGVGYTVSWVLMDYPGGVIPVREITERDLEGEIPAGEWERPLNAWDRNNQRGLWGRKKEERRHYLGTVMGVQVLAPRLQERRLCRAMTIIDEVLKAEREKGGDAGAGACSLGAKL